MLSLFLEWGECIGRLSLRVYARVRRPFRKNRDSVFEVTLKHPPFTWKGTQVGRSGIETLEVSARSVRGATTKALKVDEHRLSLSGPFLKMGPPEVVSVRLKDSTPKRET